MSYSREYEELLIDILLDWGYSADTILSHFLGWLSSDQTCEILEDFFTDQDIELPQ